MNKYLKLFKQSLILKLSREMAYKWNFIIKSIGIITWDLVGPLIILLIYTYSSGVPGWAFEHFILLIGTLELTTGIGKFLFIEFPFDVVDAIREGEFDLYLLKPYNPLTFLSLTGVDLDSIINVIIGLILIIFAFIKLELTLLSINTLIFILLVFFGVVFLHAAMILIAAIAVIAVKSFALFDLFFKIFDIVRYPITIYTPEIRFFLTFLLPIAVTSFYPAQALMSGLSLKTILSVCIPLLFFWTASVFIWKIALKKYSSAGG